MRWFEQDEPEPARVPEPSSALVPPPRRPPTAVGVPEDEPQPKQPRWWRSHWSTLFARLVMAIERLPLIPRSMAGGAANVCGIWLMVITRFTLFFPSLLVLLLITSATPLSDLMLVGVSFLIATGCGALAALASEWLVRRRPQINVWRTYANVLRLLSCAPFIILMGLLARTESGAILLAATLAILLVRRSLGRWLRKARAKWRLATVRQ